MLDKTSHGGGHTANFYFNLNFDYLLVEERMHGSREAQH